MDVVGFFLTSLDGEEVVHEAESFVQCLEIPPLTTVNRIEVF